MTTHRPLSDWVLRVTFGPDGTAGRVPGVGLNDGDERADARELPEFTDVEWARAGVRFKGNGEERLVLGLSSGGDRVVVELDDMARPLPVSEQAVELIDRFEREWPTPEVRPGDVEILRDESLGVRFVLLDRLESEGEPAPPLFHVLPWERVGQFADQVSAALDGTAPPSGLELGHWFTVTGSRFTAALEQLNAGLRRGDDVIVRVAATALCRRLLDLDPDRVPEGARPALMALTARLAARDPFLRHTAGRLSARYGPAASAESLGDTTHGLRTALLGAASESDERSRTDVLELDPFSVTVTVTEAGAVEVIVEAALSPEEVSALGDAYVVPVVRVAVVENDRSVGYLIPLAAAPSGFEGALRLPAHGGFRIRVTLPPTGAADSLTWDEDEVIRSIALSDGVGRTVWRRLADTLDADHPVVRALS